MNKGDRELLELAAKAMGAELVVSGNEVSGVFTQIKSSIPFVWNPLINDGDAFRLAVKLHLTVRCYMGNACAQRGVPGEPSAYVDATNCEDPGAAARRAIVLAAAQVGEWK